MIEAEHLCAWFGAGKGAPSVHVLANPWWPLIALLVGVVLIVVGGFLFSP
jgi:hypothetical protein